MVEVLVALVIIGLTSALAVPNIQRWLQSREDAVVREELGQILALLPMQASLQNTRIIVTQDLLNQRLPGANISITTPFAILPNGYCLGGNITLTQNEFVRTLRVLPPFCRVEPANVQG